MPKMDLWIPRYVHTSFYGTNMNTLKMIFEPFLGHFSANLWGSVTYMTNAHYSCDIIIYTKNKFGNAKKGRMDSKLYVHISFFWTNITYDNDI